MNFLIFVGPLSEAKHLILRVTKVNLCSNIFLLLLNEFLPFWQRNLEVLWCLGLTKIDVALYKYLRNNVVYLAKENNLDFLLLHKLSYWKKFSCAAFLTFLLTCKTCRVRVPLIITACVHRCNFVGLIWLHVTCLFFIAFSPFTNARRK